MKSLLRKEAFDWLVSLTMGVIIAAISWRIGVKESSRFLPVVALSLSGFTVAAFNLRFRVIDALLKLTLEHAEVEGLERLFRRCRRSINLAILAFIAAASLLGMGALYGEWPIYLGAPATGLAWAAFVFSFLKFIRILRVFGMLEDFTLSSIAKVAAKPLEASE